MKSLLRTTLDLLATVIVLTLFTSCHPDDPVDNRLTRTVLLYMVAENSLSYGNFHEQDLAELESVVDNIPLDTKVLAYVDDTGLPRLYSIERTPGGDTRKLIRYWEMDHNSCDPANFREILQYVIDSYPSKGYGLVMWSHGSGWTIQEHKKAAPRQTSSTVEDEEGYSAAAIGRDESSSALPSTPHRTIGIDNGTNGYSNNGRKMNISEMAEALEGLPKFDFILFDACFMQCIEVAWELRNATYYVIGSPAEIPGPGAPYQSVIDPMTRVVANPTSITDAYYHCYADSSVWVNSYHSQSFGVILSAIATEALPLLHALTAEMIEHYGSRRYDSKLNDEVLHYYPLSSKYDPYAYDMLDYMCRLITNDDDRLHYRRVFEQAVPIRRYTNFWYSQYTGGHLDVTGHNCGAVSMYVPLPDSYFEDLNKQYHSVSWYQGSGWDKLGF